MIIYPKISIVTPSFNQSKYLEQTILSIISQNYPNLEYVIIDGGSTDGSIDIIKKYEKHITYWVSESDHGNYHAIQKGFLKTTGDIMSWLNSDDVLHPNSLFVIGRIFSEFQSIHWLTGVPTMINEVGQVVHVSDFRKWSKYNFYLNDYQWIQQESTFWTRNLWNRSGANLNTEYRLASDFELWNRFFKFEKLYSIRSLFGGFRCRSKNQLSLDMYEKYMEEMQSILANNKFTNEEKKIISQIKKYRFLKKIPILRYLFSFQNKYEELFDYPKELKFNRTIQFFE